MHLCLRKMYPNIRHNPSWQHGYCKQYPPNARLLTNLQRLSFATPLCNHPFYKPLHPPPSPWPSAFPLPLHPLEEERSVYTYIYVGLVGWKHRVKTRCYREGTLASRRALLRNVVGLKVPPQRNLLSPPGPSTFPLLCEREKNPLSRALPASSPCMTYALLQSTRGAIHIKPYITRQTKFSCISGKWPLLSKGLRGGKSRRLRVESLLRWMIASEDAKNPLQLCEQRSLIRMSPATYV